jgi:hypothetical protein
VRIVGDGNLDGLVDGLDAQALTAALGSSAGDARFLPTADLDHDGRITSSDAQLLGVDFGFVTNLPPSVSTTTAHTHQDLEVTVPIMGLATDADGDTVSYLVSGAFGGTAQLSADGSAVRFLPGPGFAGVGNFQLHADDGVLRSEPVTISVNVSDAPLVRINFGEWSLRLQEFQPKPLAVTGDFTDESGVPLPASYLALGSEHPEIAIFDAGGAVLGTRRWLTLLSASHDNFQAFTTAFAGTLFPAQTAEEAELYVNDRIGTFIYPSRVTLVPGMTRQVLVSPSKDFDEPPELPSRFFVGNTSVATISTDGLITVVGVGSTDVTVINGLNEYLLPVSVQSALGSQVTIGADGGVLQASNGALLTIAPGALQVPAQISLTPLTQEQVTQPMPEGFGFLGGFQLEMGSNRLKASAQVAFPVGPKILAGTQVLFLLQGTIPNPQGGVDPAWIQIDDGFVDEHGFARTASPPYSGLTGGARYVIATGPDNGAVLTKIKGRFHVDHDGDVATYDLLAQKSRGAGTAIPMPVVSGDPTAFLTTDVEVSRLIFRVVPRVGPTIDTTVNVQVLDTHKLNTFEVCVHVP